MMTPAIMNKMRLDFLRLIYGIDGADCTVSWSNPGVGAVIDPVYNEISGAVVTGSAVVRCHVNKIFGDLEVKKSHLVDVMAGDAIILFDKNQNFPATGQNLLFHIQNMGQWRAAEKPPNTFESYARLLPGGESFVQAIYMRRVSTNESRG